MNNPIRTLILAAIAAACCNPLPADGRLPNLIVIVSDDQGYRDVGYNAPHSPFEAPAEEIAKFAQIKNEKRRTYAAMISVMDRGGRKKP